MEEQIKAEFERSGFSFAEEVEILPKCLTYCINFKLSASDLVSHWEVYYLNRQLSGLRVENADMDGFLSHLLSEQKESIIKEEPYLHVYSSNDVNMLLNDESEDFNDSFLGTPVNQLEREQSELHSPSSNIATNEKAQSGTASRLVSNHVTPFGQRSNKFVSLFMLNTSGKVDTGAKDLDFENTEDEVIRRVQPCERCTLQVHRSQPEPGCRFMYDRIEDKFNYLENRIRRHTTEFVSSGLYGEPTAAALASQKDIFSVGMVCCDGEGHLNEKSIILQGSAEHSGGERVRLDLHKLAHYSLFPGQVIGLEGHNPSGHYFIASKVVDSLPVIPKTDILPHPKKQALEQECQEKSLCNSLKALSLVIASGPYTTTDNLLFEPLTELLAYARRKQPQLLVLMGPFLDSDHPELKNGTVDRFFDDIFHEEILRRLLDYTEYMGSAARVILVPSIRDANHDFVFPQPPFDVHLPQDINNQISFLANPNIFSANEILIGCSTVDVLKHLSSEEISRMPANSSSSDRMGRIANHVLNQRSFYPLYPPAPVVPLDLSLAPEALEITSTLDVLLLPSDLAPFVKVLSVGEGEVDVQVQLKCLCVNPGRLAKGIGGGTFVEVNYNGDPDTANASIIRI